jgi:putative ABC transport system substrate-binding protein
VERQAFVAGAVSIVAAPLAAEAQVSGRLPRVGYLGFVSAPTFLVQALKDLGWEHGRNFTLEWRVTQGDPARLPTLAAELVRLNPE